MSGRHKFCEVDCENVDTNTVFEGITHHACIPPAVVQSCALLITKLLHHPYIPVHIHSCSASRVIVMPRSNDAVVCEWDGDYCGPVLSCIVAGPKCRSDRRKLPCSSLWPDWSTLTFVWLVTAYWYQVYMAIIAHYVFNSPSAQLIAC